MLVEGWNTGWDGDWIANRDAFSFTKSYPDYDLAAVAAYAKQKGVRLIVHNETSGGIENYERQMDTAFALYRSLGLDAIKTGYVTDLTSAGDSHYSQTMVEHYRRVIELAARDGIMLDVHEPMHDTGERRTYPNMMSREGARGQEYNAWSGDGGNPPEHETILFFTRMLAGPMDFTPGIFDLLLQRGTGRPRRLDEPRPRTTLAKQLALYVVLYSPLQMAADLPENYVAQPAFQFIRDVAVDWDTTRVLDGRIGDYVVVARRERGGQSWYRRRDHRRIGANTRRPAVVSDARQAVRRRGVRRRPGRELVRQSAARHDHTAHGNIRDTVARRDGPGRGTGNPHPASEVTRMQSQLPSPSVDRDMAQSPMQAATAILHQKPRLSFWEIWNMSFGFLGIQIGFALQNANVSRIFETLGAKVEDIPLLWIAAPVTGLLVQPVVGYFSDRTWNRLGRRRPYFLGGAILASLALLAMPNSPVLWVAAGVLWLMDASINISMEPFRAFVGDNLTSEQRTTGFAMQSFLIGTGAVAASILPWLLTNQVRRRQLGSAERDSRLGASVVLPRRPRCSSSRYSGPWCAPENTRRRRWRRSRRIRRARCTCEWSGRPESTLPGAVGKCGSAASC